MNEYKSCTVCKQTQAIEQFGFNNRQKQIYKSQCKSCDTKRMAVYNLKNRQRISENKRRYYLDNHDEKLLQSRKYRQENPERVKASYQTWLADNLEQVRFGARNRKGKRKAAQTGTVTSKDIATILSKPCIYCGSSENLHLEHVVPIARGGKHSLGNLASACARCNLSKNKWFVMEWKLKLKKWGMSF